MIKIYTIGDVILALIVGCIVTFIIMSVKHDIEDRTREEKRFEQLPLSKCDSLVLSNDSLVTRMVTLENRLLQYQTGLSFLKDKDKKAYDYAVNAGNLKFEDLW